MHAPPRARIRLNGQPATLKDIHAGDRIEVEHLLDPTGSKGELISTLEAFRAEDLAGFVESINLPQRTLTISEVRGQKGGRVLPVAADAALTFTSGEPLAFDAIRAGDRISVQVDTVIRKAEVTRGDITEQGALLEVRKDNTILIRANTGNEILLKVPKDVDVRLGQDRNSPRGLVFPWQTALPFPGPKEHHPCPGRPHQPPGRPLRGDLPALPPPGAGL